MLSKSHPERPTSAGSNSKPHTVDWVRLTDPHGKTYYYNTKSAISRWDEPAEFHEPTPRTIKQVHAKGVVVPEQTADPNLKRVLNQMAGDTQLTAGKKEASGGMLRAVQSLNQLRGTVKGLEQKVQGMVTTKKVEDRRCWGRPERLRTASGEGEDLSSMYALCYTHTHTQCRANAQCKRPGVPLSHVELVRPDSAAVAHAEHCVQVQGGAGERAGQVGALGHAAHAVVFGNGN